MHEIIERQKVGTFVKKIELEWPDSIDHMVWETAFEVHIYLKEGLSPTAFVKNLMPKVAMFIDFKSLLVIHYLKYDGSSVKSMVFNFENELVAFPEDLEKSKI
ncbi:hypothetical protein [Pedobacter jamesrossensis]|uniref:Uncharacterized protein n=1 Tax=Pedobacter jamesrossensis TaxID=1908238 RepID=A0ABV8NMJ8_9SPHI